MKRLNISILFIISAIILLMVASFFDYSNKEGFRNPIKILGFVMSESSSSGPANIYVSVTPHSSQVYIDNNLIKDKSPLAINNINSGMHQITAINEAYKDFTIRANALNGYTSNVIIKLPYNTENYEQGVIFINSDLKDSKVYLDGIFIATNPIYTNSIVGNHTVRASKKGYYHNDQNVEILKDYTTFINLDISSLEKSHEKKIQIYLQSNPVYANVKLDGSLIGQTPMVIYTNEGQHSISLSKEGYLDSYQVISVDSNSKNNVMITLNQLADPSQSSSGNDQQPLHLTKNPDSKCPKNDPDCNNYEKKDYTILNIILLILILIVLSFVFKEIIRKKKRRR